jgi:hypothetical protein
MRVADSKSPYSSALADASLEKTGSELAELAAIAKNCFYAENRL